MAELRHLWLQHFRNYDELALELGPGRIVITGQNGQGKSNLIEAIAWLGMVGSFRGAPPEALIQRDEPSAVVRGEVVVDTRTLLIEAELKRSGANRLQVNKQRVSPASALASMVPVTVFGPDDLDLVKAGPAVRRGYLDDLLVQLHPRNDRLRSELDRVLRQRNALLRQSKGRLSPDVEATLVVWDAKFVELGETWGSARAELVERLAPEVDAAYEELAGPGHPVTLRYEPTWRVEGLAEALRSVRDHELRRGVTLAGPHRDELDVSLSSMPARTHSSQGEQRTLALALRIGGHHVLGMSCGTSPLLLLDDVFSELDEHRSRALLDQLVADQTFITTAGPVPDVNGEVRHLQIERGHVVA